MTTTQIIIVSIPFIILIISILRLEIKNDKNSFDSFLFILSIYSIGFLFFIIYSLTEDNNELRKQIKGKCPEYEKIENVYRLK
jgi:archaellum biogenesis protein FlaJ (TadC family)